MVLAGLLRYRYPDFYVPVAGLGVKAFSVSLKLGSIDELAVRLRQPCTED